MKKLPVASMKLVGSDYIFINVDNKHKLYTNEHGFLATTLALQDKCVSEGTSVILLIKKVLKNGFLEVESTLLQY